VSPATKGRLEGLDGLRGLAMLGVIFCHLHVFNLGWTGLSSFFVLSGFLITRILMGDLQQSAGVGGYFKRYYIRRTLRVFPVYYAYLIALTIAAATVPALAKLQDELPAAFLYVYNFQSIVVPEHSRMLNHLWSLSVEEQFYLIWPWIIALVPRRHIPTVCLVLIAAGPVVREALTSMLFPALGAKPEVIPIYTYLTTASHFDAFAFGALINFVDWRPRTWHLLATIALAFTVGLLVNGSFGMDRLSFGWPLFMPRAHQYAWGYTLVNFFWFLVICAILAGGRIQRFFSLPVLDYLGKRSYSTYIIHYPVLGAFSAWWEGLLHAHGFLIGTAIFVPPYLAVVFALSAASYRFIEMPCNQLRDRFQARQDRARASRIAELRPAT
jgi:peptidoglycan/LPS O-acetylase OafA/YrhL